MTEPPSPGAYAPQAWDEQQWRRPPTEPEPSDTAEQAAPAYTGPPRALPVDAAWRPPTVIKVPPARPLPPQDDAAVDGQEQQARTVTHGVGMIAGAVALIVLIVLCGRVLF